MEVPGAAVSPGASNCNFANAPTLTVIEELVLAVMPALVTSDAVTVALPTVFKVTLRVCVPPTSAASPGRLALLSLEVRWTVSLVLIAFQLASTALTVMLNPAPAV